MNPRFKKLAGELPFPEFSMAYTGVVKHSQLSAEKLNTCRKQYSLYQEDPEAFTQNVGEGVRRRLIEFVMGLDSINPKRKPIALRKKR